MIIEVQRIATDYILNRIMANYTNETCDMNKFLQEHPFLSGLVGKNGVLFECYGDAPSPSKDYGQIQININQVIHKFLSF
jgi:hypothetical protein